ncbi:MAG TPA: DNA polymerase III subunit delta [Syntrophales bacterium]|nr:DNA polymerase III subunit delta [Syntrophales bacterium]
MSRREQSSEKSIEGVLEDIAKGKGASCYLLYGDEEFLVEEALGKIVDALVPGPDRDLSLFVMDDESGGVNAVCETLLTPSLIPGPKAVVLRKTRLFYSKSSLSELAKKVADSAETDLPSAARTFMALLDVAGWDLEQLRDEGWRRIPDAQWRETLGEEGAAERDKWLPRVLEHCLSHNLAGGAAPGSTEALEDLLSAGLPEGHVLVVSADSVDRRKRLFKVMADRGVVLAFVRARNEARQRSVMMETLREKLARKGKTLSPEAWAVLGRKTGFRLRDSAEALDQLITYTGDRTRIETADVEAVIGRTRDDTVFDLTEALAGQDARRALASLGDLLYQGVHPLVILAMIAREIRFLVHGKAFLGTGRLGDFRADMDFGRFQKTVYPAVKAFQDGPGKGATLANQHPYVIYNALRNSARYPFGELLSRMRRVLAADVAMKSAGQEPRLLLERLLIDLCGQAGARRQMPG